MAHPLDRRFNVTRRGKRPQERAVPFFIRLQLSRLSNLYLGHGLQSYTKENSLPPLVDEGETIGIGDAIDSGQKSSSQISRTLSSASLKSLK